jgi:hypothetical protein
VEVPAGTHPWLAPGTRSLVVSFPAGGETPGWVLLAGALAEGSESLLPAVGAYVRLGLGRLTAAAGLRRANAVLERRVAERTEELARERTSLEMRVRERTRELEEAKRSTVEAERRLLDLERTENVQRLAAGLAHEVNNPIGATRANLDFAIDALQRLLPGLDPTARGDATDALEAVADSRREVARVAESVASLFGGAAASRRVSVRTPVGAVLRDAVDAHARVEAGPSPVLVERATIACGVTPGECFRWFFRLLGVLGRDRRTVSVEVDLADDGPRVTLRSEGASALGSLADADDLADEIRRAGGQLRARAVENRATVEVVLPRAAGDRAVSAPEGVR